VTVPWKGVLAVVAIVVLWFFAVCRPLTQQERKWTTKTERAQARVGELSQDSSSLSEKRTRAQKLINGVGYTRPTTNAAQEARMLEQIEVACRLAPLGLIEVVRMEPEVVPGPEVNLEGGETKVNVTYIRHPVQVQTNGPLQGTIQFLADLRRTNPMMMVDRLALASSDDTGYVRMRCVLSSLRPNPASLEGGGTS
jgi:hypothetical protein